MPTQSTPVPPPPGRFVLTASVGGGLCGRLEGEWLAEGLLEAQRITLEAVGDPEAALRAFARAFRAATPRPEGEVMSWDDERRGPWLAALRAAGFEVVRRKVVVERALAEPFPTPGNWSTRSLREVGEAGFLREIALVAQGDPYEASQTQDVPRWWRELVVAAGTDLDPTRWCLVDDARGPVGVVLPQPVATGTGTLLYLGVRPERRGSGLGRGLHALGLAGLAALGLTRYVGSTDVRNLPMRRVFASNGCRVKGTRAFLRHAPFATP